MQGWCLIARWYDEQRGKKVFFSIIGNNIYKQVHTKIHYKIGVIHDFMIVSYNFPRNLYKYPNSKLLLIAQETFRPAGTEDSN